MSILVSSIVLIPALVCAFFSLAWWFQYPLSERSVARLTTSAFFLSSLLSFVSLGFAGRGVRLQLGEWYSLSGYEYVWQGVFDPLSLTFAGMASFALGLVSHFSRDYLHQERGFLRFYLLTLILGIGVEVIVLAASMEQVFFGWELVGLSSALLIGFFSHRPGPARGGVRAYLTYRFCDIGLLAAVVLIHHSGTATFFSQQGGQWLQLAPRTDQSQNLILVLLLLWACAGKSALVPFGGWLPRAMEGPTPSSAIFYGALSIHLGPYLMLRCAPLIEQSRWGGPLVVAVGLLTALHGTLVGRVQSDVKCALAYGSMTQVGLIFVEIGMGWYWVAGLHMIGHASIRTLEILRAPSVLHDYHNIETSLGKVLPRMGLHYERLLPRAWQLWLYRLALERGYSEAFLLNAIRRWRKSVGLLDTAERFIEGRIMGLSAPGREKVEPLR
ncbi:MAG: proton-conducting transporter membrane subunit [Vulcanimicrobiota bacterium]